MDKDIDYILKAEKAQLHKLRNIVNKSIDEETLILDHLLHPPAEQLTKSQLLSDRMAKFGGSWSFIISFFIVLIVWIVFNVLAVAKYTFDPFPFILMNLILSCIAALQAPIIMMSQNRQEEKDRQRSENDYLINLKAELEIKSINQKIDLLIEDQIKALFESQVMQLEILKEIQQKK